MQYHQHRAGVSRRELIQAGYSGLLGVGLSSVLGRRSQAAPAASADSPRSPKSVIIVFLTGACSHHDTFDMKLDAPAEIRGEFQTIQTNVPGISVSEMFPRMAQMMDKFVLIRSLADSANDHDAYQCMTGRHRGGRTPPGGWPQAGAWVSHALGPVNSAVPANVAD